MTSDSLPPADDSASPRVLSIGECMLELRPDGNDRYELGFGGDTLNTAIYLARLGLRADYATALGDDPYSDVMVEGWLAEGVGTDLVVRLSGCLPGFYIIRNGPNGERSFHYWRDSATARRLFSCAGTSRVVDQAFAYDWIYLSGVTLSLYDASGLDVLHELLVRYRASGGRVAFDGNYRPPVWPGRTAARTVFDRFYPQVDLALPSFEDEHALYGDADGEACASRLAARGIGEVVVKQGASGCVLAMDGKQQVLPIDKPVIAVDATAAGDAFNAGYLAARLTGRDPVAAATAGRRLAEAVVTRRGAIIPREAMPAGVLAT